ncbi:MAG: transglutaminase-like domain-containing protein [Janthinobacterium lividum]
MPNPTCATHVRARLDLRCDIPSSAALLVAVARREGVEIVAEELTTTGPDGEFAVRELPDRFGTLLHEFTVPAGASSVEYTATVRIDEAGAPALTDTERWEFTRPSRYCPSDRLLQFASREFGRVPREELANTVAQWVFDNTGYLSGSSLPTDTALETLLARQGVCRDFAHLTTSLLRAMDVPARLCAVYAPGLSPMDFHAVVEAAPTGTWEIVDATRLAPRQALVRISTGRDAADTAFLTTAGPVRLETLEVLAVLDGELPADDALAGVTLP